MRAILDVTACSAVMPDSTTCIEVQLGEFFGYWKISIHFDWWGFWDIRHHHFFLGDLQAYSLLCKHAAMGGFFLYVLMMVWDWSALGHQ